MPESDRKDPREEEPSYPELLGVFSLLYSVEAICTAMNSSEQKNGSFDDLIILHNPILDQKLYFLLKVNYNCEVVFGLL